MIYRQFFTPFDVMSDAQRKALEYWRSLKAADGEDAPLQKAFKLIDLPPPILPTTHLADVSEGGDEFRFRYWGSGMTEFLGYDATGGTTRDLIPRVMGDRLHEVFRSIVRTRRAMAMVSEFERPNSGVVGFQKFVRMPLLAEDGRVGQILSVVEFLVDCHAARDMLSNVIDTPDAQTAPQEFLSAPHIEN